MPFWMTKLLVRTGLARFSARARRLTDGGTSYLHYYSDRVLSAPVEDLLDPAIIPDPVNPQVIHLNQSSLSIESSVNFFRSATENSATASPRGIPELREAIANRYQVPGGRELDAETEVHVTHGATGAYFAALEALVNPGDRVVLFDPDSPLLGLGAKSRRASICHVPTCSDDGRCRFDKHSFERAMRGAKLLALSHPCNPTGTAFDREDMDYIAWIAAAYDVLIYVDESFRDFWFEEEPHSFGSVTGASDRMLRAGSVTQSLGLGSLRTGWLVGSRHLVRACGLMANLNAPGVPIACQRKAARELQEIGKRLTSQRERLLSKRDYTLDRLRGMALEPACPRAGLFIWAPISSRGMDGRTFATRLFREDQVLVGPGCAFGPGAAGHIRISLAGDEGRLREGLARLAHFLDRLKGGLNQDGEPWPEAAVPEPVEVRAVPVELARPAFSRF